MYIDVQNYRGFGRDFMHAASQFKTLRISSVPARSAAFNKHYLAPAK